MLAQFNCKYYICCLHDGTYIDDRMETFLPSALQLPQTGKRDFIELSEPLTFERLAWLCASVSEVNIRIRIRIKHKNKSKHKNKNKNKT